MLKYQLSITTLPTLWIGFLHPYDSYCTNPYQGKFVDLDINDLHLSVGHLTAVAFVLLVGL